MAKNKVTLRSDFPAVVKAGHEAVQKARDLALNVGEGEAEKRLERIDNTRGYDLPIDIQQEKTGFQSGRIYYEPFYGRWFEYGTVHIEAAPFMRPAHRKMRKTFKDELGEHFEGFIRRKVRIRR